jgi:hypothetical protein
VCKGCVAPGECFNDDTVHGPTPSLITNAFSITPWEVPTGTKGTFKLITWLPRAIAIDLAAAGLGVGKISHVGRRNAIAAVIDNREGVILL